MKTHRLFNSYDNNSIMRVDNIFSKINSFSNITTDEKNICVFLSVAKNNTIKIEQLVKETKLELKDIVISLHKLEKGDFVEKNPSPLSEKYTLGFNGQLFAEQLKNMYPQVKSFLGDKKIIKPLKV